MERYRGVLGKKRIASTTAALEASGVSIVRAPKPTEAPFEYTIHTPSGETLDLICYAFTANQYLQQGRPSDEHRFQVKYGSEFHRAHRIYIDPSRARITLMYGVHDSLPVFVAVDPAMHNPTWFSSSVEFKQEDLEQATKKGWHGWERERVATGRRRVQLASQDLRTEIVLGFRPEHFLKYALFERLATGMDPGERLSLADQVEARVRRRRSALDLLELPKKGHPGVERHPLLTQLGLTTEELLGVIGGRFRLFAAVRGSVAEHHLGRMLEQLSDLERVTRLDEDGKPDFLVEYRRRKFRIECKNVLARLIDKRPRVDFQKTRASKGNPCSRYYASEQFEILAACLHPITKQWSFSFCPTNVLPPHRKCAGRLDERVSVGGPGWTNELPALLDRLMG